jgi:hypothetical protein
MLNRAGAVAFFFRLCYFLVVASTAAVSQVDRGAIVAIVTDLLPPGGNPVKKIMM